MPERSEGAERENKAWAWKENGVHERMPRSSSFVSIEPSAEQRLGFVHERPIEKSRVGSISDMARRGGPKWLTRIFVRTDSGAVKKNWPCHDSIGLRRTVDRDPLSETDENSLLVSPQFATGRHVRGKKCFPLSLSIIYIHIRIHIYVYACGCFFFHSCVHSSTDASHLPVSRSLFPRPGY